MTKPNKKTAPSPRRPAATQTPATLAARVLSSHLSNDELYSEVLNQVSAEDFDHMQDAIIATWRPDRPHDDNERDMAMQEVCFMLGLEIGRRVSGAR